MVTPRLICPTPRSARDGRVGNDCRRFDEHHKVPPVTTAGGSYCQPVGVDATTAKVAPSGSVSNAIRPTPNGVWPRRRSDHSSSRSTAAARSTPRRYSHCACGSRAPRNHRRTVDSGRPNLAAIVLARVRAGQIGVTRDMSNKGLGEVGAALLVRVGRPGIVKGAGRQVVALLTVGHAAHPGPHHGEPPRRRRRVLGLPRDMAPIVGPGCRWPYDAP